MTAAHLKVGDKVWNVIQGCVCTIACIERSGLHLILSYKERPGYTEVDHDHPLIFDGGYWLL